jgi:hypothetical protein
MSKRDQGPAFAEEVLLRLCVYTTLLSEADPKTKIGGHRTPIGMHCCDLGLEKAPEFTDAEMQQIMYAAKMAALKCLFARNRRVKRKRVTG